MNKKVLVSLIVLGGTLLLTKEFACADGLEEALEAYLNNPSFDLLGKNYDKILFEYSGTDIVDKLKFMLEDIKTLPLQAKCTFKIMEQNKYIYGSLGGFAGLKAFMGEKAFGEMLFKILKVIVK